jgi:cobalamin biosynthesis Mg chelatase CobN
MDGQVVKYMVANGMTDFSRGNYEETSMFEGEINGEDEFPETMMLEFSNASGKRKKKSGRKKSSTMKSRMLDRQKARKDRKDRKLAIKEKTAETQKSVAENIGKTSPEEAKLLESLATDTTKTTPASTGMSKGLKIGLIVGGVLVVGTIVFIVIRKMKKKKK